METTKTPTLSEGREAGMVDGFTLIKEGYVEALRSAVEYTESGSWLSFRIGSDDPDEPKGMGRLGGLMTAWGLDRSHDVYVENDGAFGTGYMNGLAAALADADVAADD